MTLFTKPPTTTNWVAIWRYIRHELIYIAWGVMEASLITAFTIGLFRFARLWSPTFLFLYLFSLILIPFNLSRIMHMVDLPLLRAKNIQLTGLLLAIFFGLRMLLYPGFILDPRWLLDLGRDFFDIGNPFWWRNLVFTLLIILAWWRGLAMTTREVNIDSMGLRIRVGGLFLLPMAVIFAGNILSLRLTPFIILYFLATLIAISLTRAEEIAKHPFSKGHAMSVRWFGAILLASLSIVLVAVLGGAMAGKDSLELLQTWLGPVWLAIYFSGVVILRTTLYLATPLIRVIAGIIDYIFGIVQRMFASLLGDEVVPINITNRIEEMMPDMQEGVEPVQSLQIPPEVGRILILVCTSALIIVIIFVVNRTFRLRQLALDSDGQALGREELSVDIGGGLKAWLNRWRGYDRRHAAASIRRLYRQMCRTAGQHGFPRQEAETPYEYLTSLDKLWVNSGDQVRIITDAYVRIRYGELPESQAELDEIKAAWVHLKKTIVKD